MIIGKKTGFIRKSKGISLKKISILIGYNISQLVLELKWKNAHSEKNIKQQV
jgi:hypothetical protein